MASSMMLRDERGAIAGYVLLQDGRLHACLRRAQEGTRLTALNDAGGRIELTLHSGGGEETAAFDAASISTAYAHRGGALLAWGNEQGRQAFEQEQRAGREKNDNSCNSFPDSSVLQEEKSERSLPQRRWPPPPCWPSARYMDGCWKEAGEG